MSTKKYTCGMPLPSACVLFTGDLPSFIPETSVPCDANLDEILAKTHAQVEKLLASTDLTSINKQCFVFDNSSVKSFASATITKVCSMEEKLTALKLAFDGLNIGNHLVSIDLKCLKPAAAPCLQGTDNYTLLSILNLLVAEVCLIKSHLNL